MVENDRTVILYYLYRMTTANGFWIPYSYVYLLSQGYDEATFGFANAAFLFTMVASEIPAGYVGDRFGRRVSLGIGNLIATLVFGLYAFTGNSLQVITLFSVWGVGYAFHSATGEAWIYDLLDDNTDRSTGEFAQISGRSETASLLASAGGAIAATPLYWVNPAFPFLANAILSAVGIPVLGALPATETDHQTNLSVRRVVRMFRRQVNRPGVRWLVVYIALFNMLLSVTRWLEQPALKTAGVPLAGFGALYASFQLISAGATLTTGWLDDRLGAEGFFLLLAPLIGFAYGLIAIVPTFVVPVVYLRRVLARIIGPLRDQYLNDRLNRFGRATVLSGFSMVLTFASGVSAAVFGPLAAAMGPLSFLPWAGVIVAAVAALLWVTTTPVRPVSDYGKAVTTEGVADD